MFIILLLGSFLFNFFVLIFFLKKICYRFL